MTLYNSVDGIISQLCDDCISGSISLGRFQSILLENINKIVSVEDKNVRNLLHSLEASLDRDFALYYGASGIDNLECKFITDDIVLKNMIEPTIKRIKAAVGK